MFESLNTLFFSTQIISGSEGVTGINTDTHAAFIFHSVYNFRQMLKAEPQITALTRGVFYHGRHAFSLAQRAIPRLRDFLQTFIFIDLHQMAALMEVQQRQAELFAALEFIKKRLAGFLKCFGDRVPQVRSEEHTSELQS